MIETGLRQWILQQASIVNRLTGSGSSPVYIDDADQDAHEYMLIESAGVEADDTLDDFAPENDLIDETVGVTVKAATVGKAKSIAQSLLQAGISRISGQLGNRNVEGIWFQGMESDYEPPDEGEAKGRHTQTINLQFHHRGR